jgi:hypothetical protein
VTTSLRLGDLGFNTMPVGLDPSEAHAYRQGFDRAVRSHLKKHGSPSVVHDGPPPPPGSPERRALGVELADLGREYRIARHEAAHKAGMTALRTHLKRRGREGRLSTIVDPCAPAKKASTPKIVADLPTILSWLAAHFECDPGVLEARVRSTPKIRVTREGDAA